MGEGWKERRDDGGRGRSERERGEGGTKGLCKGFSFPIKVRKIVNTNEELPQKDNNNRTATAAHEDALQLEVNTTQPHYFSFPFQSELRCLLH